MDIKFLVDQDFELIRESEGQLKKSKDKEGKLWRIVVIEEGYSKNKDAHTGKQRYYTEQALRQMEDMFEGVGVFAYGFNVPEKDFFNHIPEEIRVNLPEGLSGNVVGWVENVEYVKDTGQDSGRLEADFHCIADWLRERLQRSWEKKKKDLLGFSIDVKGYSEPASIGGRVVSAVKAIKEVNELTVVTDPAGGGRVLRLVASVNKGNTMEKLKAVFEKLEEGRPEIKNLSEEEKTADFLLNMLKNLTIETPESEEERNSESDKLVESLKEKVQEAIKAIESEDYVNAVTILEKVVDEYGVPMYGHPYPAYGYPYPEAPEQKESNEPAEPEEKKVVQKDGEKDSAYEKRVKALEEKIAKQEAETALESLVDNDKILPEPVKEKLREDFGGRTFEREELRDAVKREKKMLESLTESGQIKGLGEQAEVGLEKRDKFEIAFEKLIDKKAGKDDPEYKGVQPFRSLREAYRVITGDKSQRVRGKVADNLRESTTSDFPNILGNTLHRRVLDDFRTREQIWRPLVDVVNVSDFKQQELIRWGGFSFLQDLTEDADYPVLATPQSSEETYSAGQKGGEFYVTRKMIINDDTRALQKIPAKLGKAASVSLEQFVMDLIIGWTSSGINTYTLADSKAIYHDDHFNKITSAISYDNLTLMVEKMMEQWEYGAEDALNGAVNDSVTTWTVDDGTKFKAGDYVRCESEIARVTAVSTNDLTVVRAQYGTSADGHDDDDVVTVLTDQIGAMPAYLLVPPALRAQAYQYYNNENKPGTGDRDVNTLYELMKPVVSTRLRGDQNNYFAIADPDEIPGVEVGFLGGQEEPEIITQDQPSQGEVFNKDRITYKIRHEYGGAPAGFRFAQGGIVS
jgi:hypothetical protein